MAGGGTPGGGHERDSEAPSVGETYRASSYQHQDDEDCGGGATEDTSLLPVASATPVPKHSKSRRSTGAETSFSSDATYAEEEQESPEISRVRLWWGVCYALAMGVCGIVLVALGSTLASLAADCGTTSTKVGTVFIARGIGAVTGALLSAKLYAPPRPGNLVMVVVLIALSSILLCMPFVRTTWLLHGAWFGLGACTATLDTGCQIMTRKVHGVHAGPWLGANTVVFAIAGAFVPLIELLTGQLFAQYATLAGIALFTAVALFASPHPESPDLRDRLPPRLSTATTTSDKRRQTTKGTSLVARYPLELVFSAAVFWLIGGKVDTTSYIVTYVKVTNVVKPRDASVALLVLWIAITVGRLLGLKDQIALKKRSTRVVYWHLTAWLLTGTFGMLVACLFSHRAWAFWLGVALYGLGNGPCVGYAYDLVNRLTVPSEMGMSIVMFGLNLGASLIPYLTTVVWDRTPAGAETLIYITLLSMFIPMPLLLLSAALVSNKGTSSSTSSSSSSSSSLKTTFYVVPKDDATTGLLSAVKARLLDEDVLLDDAGEEPAAATIFADAP